MDDGTYPIYYHGTLINPNDCDDVSWGYVRFKDNEKFLYHRNHPITGESKGAWEMIDTDERGKAPKLFDNWLYPPKETPEADEPTAPSLTRCNVFVCGTPFKEGDILVQGADRWQYEVVSYKDHTLTVQNIKQKQEDDMQLSAKQLLQFAKGLDRDVNDDLLNKIALIEKNFNNCSIWADAVGDYWVMGADWKDRFDAYYEEAKRREEEKKQKTEK